VKSMTQQRGPEQSGEGRHLSQLSEDERYRVFDEMQRAMPAVWGSMRQGFDDESVVVVPSISIERPTASSGTVMQAMEERALFLLLLLRQPRLRMIYVTSQPIHPRVLDYFFGLVPELDTPEVRRRFVPVSLVDGRNENFFSHDTHSRGDR